MTHNEQVRQAVGEIQAIWRDARRLNLAMQIRRRMKAKGLKNADLAARLDVSEANVSRWLRGRENLSLDNIHKLADAMEDSIQIIFCSSIETQSHSQEEGGVHSSSSLSEVVRACSDFECVDAAEGEALLSAALHSSTLRHSAKVLHITDYARVPSHSASCYTDFAKAKSGTGLTTSEAKSEMWG